MRRNSPRRGLLAAFVLLVAACSGGTEAESTTTTVAAQLESVVTTSTSAAPVAVALLNRPAFSLGVSESGAIYERLSQFDGDEITILTSVADFADFEAAMAEFDRQVGTETTSVITGDLIGELNDMIAREERPDIVLVPQPAQILELARSGLAYPIPSSIAAEMNESFDNGWTDLVTLGGDVFGLPVTADIKTLVWYDPRRFRQLDYRVPTTAEELDALISKMQEEGQTPWCLGIAAAGASGWPVTDWVEDVVLARHGREVYDAWIQHDIPFNDVRIREAIAAVDDMWRGGDAINGGGRSAVTKSAEQAAGELDAGECLMYRQANFVAGVYTELGRRFGFDIDVFPFPAGSNRAGDVLLGAANYAVPLTSRRATWAAMAFMASQEFPLERIAARRGGFISPNRTLDASAYPAVDRKIAQILLDADAIRFDASDVMPPEVGAGEFWIAAVDFVVGSIDADEFADRVEGAWPRG